ncbi:MAG: YihY/virulence factor BrkB family protein, partial [Actinomycetes bacterium]
MSENTGTLARVRGRVRDQRARRPALDHAVRAYDRNSEVLGNQVAGALTYFGFLSFFPLLALAFAVVGYISSVYPGAQDAVTGVVRDNFPSLIGSRPGQVDVGDLTAAKRGAGIIGVLGLLYAGLGWVDNLRDGLQRVFGTTDARLGFGRKKLADLVVLVLLGGSLLFSVVVSSTATAATRSVLGLVGLERSLVAVVLLKVLSVAL